MEVVSTFLEQINRELELLLSKPNLQKQNVDHFCARICQLSAGDVNRTAVATRVFASLSHNTQDPFKQQLFRRTAQEIRANAVRVMEVEASVPKGIALQLMQRLAITVECVAANLPVDKDVVEALVCILSNEESSIGSHDAAIRVLCHAFKDILIEPTEYDEVKIMDCGNASTDSILEEPELGKRQALVSMLMHPEVVNTLIGLLFTQAKRPPGGITKPPGSKRRKCLSMLLGHADAFLVLTRDEAREQLRNKNRYKPMRGRISALTLHVDNCAIICEELKPGCPRFLFKDNKVRTLLGGLDSSVVAVGVLEWAREGLWGAEDQRSLLVTAPKHLAYLDAIAEKHEALRTNIVDILHRGFVRKYDLNVHDKELMLDGFLDGMVSMVHYYEGQAVVENFLLYYVDDITVDEAHLRSFVKRTLQIVAPPYNHYFSAAMIDLVHHPRVKASTCRDQETIRLIKTFLEYVKSKT